MGGVGGRPVELFLDDDDGNTVMASRDGRGKCAIDPSRRMSP